MAFALVFSISPVSPVFAIEADDGNNSIEEIDEALTEEPSEELISVVEEILQEEEIDISSDLNTEESENDSDETAEINEEETTIIEELDDNDSGLEIDNLTDEISTEENLTEQEIPSELQPNDEVVDLLIDEENQEEIKFDYESQPQTLAEIQNYIYDYWYNNSDLPKFEDEVSSELLLSAWNCVYVESEEGNYYTLELDFEFTSQPNSTQEIQDSIDLFLTTFEPSDKPYWQYQIDKNLLPSGFDSYDMYDEELGVRYYSWYVGNPQPILITIVLTTYIDGILSLKNDSTTYTNTFWQINNALQVDWTVDARVGYTLEWYTNAALTNKITYPYQVSTSPLTLYGKWTINQYTVSFNSNGGSAVTAKTQNYNTSVTAPANPTRTGYTFDGWYKEAALTNKVTFPYNMGAANTTLYAKWTINNYTLSINQTTGGTISGTGSKQYNSSVTLTATPATGYSFGGWQSNSYLTGTNKTFTMPATNVTLTPIWNKINYNVTLTQAPNGTVSTSKNPANYQDSITLTVTPSTGYSHTGWTSLTPAGLLTGTNKTFSMPAQNVAITPTFAINNYNVTVNNVTGGTIGNAGSKTYNSSVTLTATPATGYTFGGWQTNAYLTGTNLTFTMPATNVTLTPIWNKINYDVTLTQAPNGTVSGPTTANYGDSVTLTVTPNSHYSHTGWTNLTPAGLLTGTNKTFSMPAQNVALTPVFTLNKYTVNFNSNGGTNVDSITQDYNTTIDNEPTTIRMGYEFDGWYSDETLLNKITFPYTILNDITLYAKWNLNSYTLTLNPNNDIDETTELMVDFNSLLTQPTISEPEGHSFSGWFDRRTKWDFAIDTMPARNLALVALYDVNTYEVTFDADNGTELDINYVVYNESVNEPETPIKTGYTFIGWFNDNDLWNFETDTIGSDHMVLKAKWSINSYTLSINTTDNGSAITDSTNPIVYNSEVNLEVTPNVGYAHTNWIVTPVGLLTGTATSFNMPASNVNLTPVFEPKSHTITFDYNGATDNNTIIDKPVIYDASIGSLPNPIKTGYNFVGWFTNNDIEYNSSTVYLTDDNITLTAKWEAESYTITFDYNGATANNDTTDTSVTYDAEIGTLPEPSKIGHSFIGWFDSLDIQYNVDTVYLVDTDITLTAKYSINNYTLSITSVTGGSVTGAGSIPYNSPVTLIANPDAEYAFTGWLHNDYISGTELTFSMPANDVELTPVFTINQYTISFNSNGGSIVTTITEDYGSDITNLAKPTKVDYVFQGWYNDSTLTNKVTMPYTLLTDVTFYAKWKKATPYVPEDIPDDMNQIRDKDDDGNTIFELIPKDEDTRYNENEERVEPYEPWELPDDKSQIKTEDEDGNITYEVVDKSEDDRYNESGDRTEPFEEWELPDDMSQIKVKDDEGNTVFEVIDKSDDDRYNETGDRVEPFEDYELPPDKNQIRDKDDDGNTIFELIPKDEDVRYNEENERVEPYEPWELPDDKSQIKTEDGDGNTVYEVVDKSDDNRYNETGDRVEPFEEWELPDDMSQIKTTDDDGNIIYEIIDKTEDDRYNETGDRVEPFEDYELPPDKNQIRDKDNDGNTIYVTIPKDEDPRYDDGERVEPYEPWELPNDKSQVKTEDDDGNITYEIVDKSEDNRYNEDGNRTKPFEEWELPDDMSQIKTTDDDGNVVFEIIDKAEDPRYDDGERIEPYEPWELPNDKSQIQTTNPDGNTIYEVIDKADDDRYNETGERIEVFEDWEIPNDRNQIKVKDEEGHEYFELIPKNEDTRYDDNDNRVDPYESWELDNGESQIKTEDSEGNIIYEIIDKAEDTRYNEENDRVEPYEPWELPDDKSQIQTTNPDGNTIYEIVDKSDDDRYNQTGDRIETYEPWEITDGYKVVEDINLSGETIYELSNLYIVTFINEGVETKVTVEYGRRIKQLVNEPREGYVFVGWYNGNTKWEFNANRMPASDIELTAKWELKVITPIDPEQPSPSNPDPEIPPKPIQPKPTPEPSKPNDNSNNTGSGSDGSSVINTIVNNLNPFGYKISDNVSLSGSVNNTKIVNELKALKDIKKPTLKIKNASYITKATLKELIEVNKDVMLYADTTSQYNNNVQGRMYITQTNLTYTGDTLKVGVWTEESKTSNIKNKFNKWYDNKVAIVYIEHEGSLGFSTPIAAKVDLSELDVSNLVFYVYDKKSNSVKQLENNSYRIDANGYLRFNVNEGGYIIVADKTLVKK